MLDWENQAVVRESFCGAANALHSVALELLGWAADLRRPHAMLRPAMSRDGNQWCALYGANLQDGVAGFGDSPELACLDFDRAWRARIGSPPAN